MSLYEKVLEYVKKQTVEYLERLSKKSFLFRLGIEVQKESLIESEFNKMKALVYAGYRNKDSTLDSETLDEIVKSYLVAEGDGQIITDEKREYVKLSVEFYQKLLRQEERIETFEEAVKKEFSYNDYMNYLEKSIEAYLKSMGNSSGLVGKLKKSKKAVETFRELCRDSANKIYADILEA